LEDLRAFIEPRLTDGQAPLLGELPTAGRVVPGRPAWTCMALFAMDKT